MKIGIDINPALDGPSGIRNHIESLLEGLSLCASEHTFYLCAFFWRDFPQRAESLRLPDAPNFKRVLRRVPHRLALPADYYIHAGWQARLLAPLELDVFHGTVGVLPRLKHTPTVATLHHVDTVPSDYPLFEKFYFNILIPASLRAATRVITISETTRTEALAELDLPPARVSTVYNGGAHNIFSTPCSPSLKQEWGIRRPYFLFVSAIDRRKNLEVLAQAYARHIKGKTSPPQLVFVARKGPYFPQFEALCRELGIEKHVLFLEGLNLEELRDIYAHSLAMVYPSIKEGYGLPLLEAMACGTPVLAADATCLPEVGADACAYFPPSDVDALSALLKRITEDEAFRKGLIARGHARAQEFSWERTARETLAVYHAAAGAA